MDSGGKYREIYTDIGLTTLHRVVCGHVSLLTYLLPSLSFTHELSFSPVSKWGPWCIFKTSPTKAIHGVRAVES